MLHYYTPPITIQSSTLDAQPVAMAQQSRDALLAQLMGMGFEPELIGRCQEAMAAKDTPFNVQAATEW